LSQHADYIVIGAGSAGCAVAARLSENTAATVLLIEAGGGNRRISVKAPAAFSKQFHTNLDWDYWTEPEPHLNGRRIFSPRGKMLGGSSEMNAMIYIRGNRLDYDSWAADGADGWSYADVLPVYRRFESNDEFSDAFHGTDGALKVTRITDPDPVSLAMVEAALELRIERNDDFNGAKQDGTGLFQVTQHRGMRCGSAEAYLAPIARRRNLTVMTNALVTRIIVEGGRAVGVEVSDRNGATQRINAHAEVIVSGGAFNTPALLQHSGIGSADFLRSVGVTPVVDLPAVGENLMEHPLVYATYELTGGHIGIADVEKPKYLLEWMIRRRGKLTSNVAEAAAHVRTDASLPAPNFQCLFAPGYFYDHGQMAWDVPAATIALSYIAPRSRGTVRIRSNDPTRKPRVSYNMLSTRSEMEEMIDAVELARDIAAAGPARSVLGAEITPGNDVRSRGDIEAWIKTTVQHTYHPSCTARIGPPQDGVVDAQLRVHGVDRLRVADASVMPTVIRGNTNAPAIMIGERCSDFIRQNSATSAAIAQTLSMESA
jgi:choline dehydrogenase